MALIDENLAYVIPVDPDACQNFLKTIDKVCHWGYERNITADGGATALSQCKKMAEELQEFIDAKTSEEAVDALGDMFVVLIQMHRLRGVMLEESLEQAWNQIKDRTGRMENGIFIKNAS